MARYISRGLTKEGHILTASGLIFIAWGLYSSDPVKMSVGLTLVALPLISILAVEVSLSLLTRNLERIVPGVPIEGRLALVEFRMRDGRSYAPPIAISIEDNPPRNLKSISSETMNAVLFPGTEITVNYKLVARTGLRKFGDVRVKVTDLLGLYSVTAEFFPEGDVYLRTRPKPFSLEVQKEAFGELLALASLAGKQRGIEFYMVREYQEGDDPRLIDWKATARLATLIVKEMRHETATPVVFLFAPTPIGDEGEPGRTPFERLSRGIAGLAEYLSRYNQPLGYIGLTDPLVLIPPAIGPKGFTSILDGLSNTPPASPIPKGVGLVLRRYLEEFLRERPLLVIASTGEYIEDVIEQLYTIIKELNIKIIALSLKGDEVVISWTKEE